MSENLQSEDENFVDKVIEQIELARSSAYEMCKKTYIKEVVCSEAVSENGAWFLPGGVTFLYFEGYLEAFFHERAAAGVKKGRLYAQYPCGYLLAKFGNEEEVDQEWLLETVKEQVELLNEKYDASFEFALELQEV